MLNAGLTEALRALPAELQEYVRRWAERVEWTDGMEVPAETAATLVRLVACSEFAATGASR